MGRILPVRYNKSEVYKVATYQERMILFRWSRIMMSKTASHSFRLPPPSFDCDNELSESCSAHFKHLLLSTFITLETFKNHKNTRLWWVRQKNFACSIFETSCREAEKNTNTDTAGLQVRGILEVKVRPLTYSHFGVPHDATVALQLYALAEYLPLLLICCWLRQFFVAAFAETLPYRYWCLLIVQERSCLSPLLRGNILSTICKFD